MAVQGHRARVPRGIGLIDRREPRGSYGSHQPAVGLTPGAATERTAQTRRRSTVPFYEQHRSAAATHDLVGASLELDTRAAR